MNCSDCPYFKTWDEYREEHFGTLCYEPLSGCSKEEEPESCEMNIEPEIKGEYADYIIMDDYLPPELTMLKVILWATGFEACYYKSDYARLGVAVKDYKREMLKPLIPLVEYLNNLFKKWGIYA